MASLYSDRFWYPDGSVAGVVPGRVFTRAGTGLAVLWQDAAETIPQSNPALTDTSGFLSFYAAPGDYWVHIGGQCFPMSLDSDGTIPDVWHETYAHTQSVPAADWIISHSMNSEPDVSVIIGGQSVPADVTFTDLNSLVIHFSSPQTGRAFLRR
jgi:hypothetical protein